MCAGFMDGRLADTVPRIIGVFVQIRWQSIAIVYTFSAVAEGRRWKKGDDVLNTDFRVYYVHNMRTHYVLAGE